MRLRFERVLCPHCGRNLAIAASRYADDIDCRHCLSSLLYTVDPHGGRGRYEVAVAGLCALCCTNPISVDDVGLCKPCDDMAREGAA